MDEQPLKWAEWSLPLDGQPLDDEPPSARLGSLRGIFVTQGGGGGMEKGIGVLNQAQQNFNPRNAHELKKQYS